MKITVNYLSFETAIVTKLTVDFYDEKSPPVINLAVSSNLKKGSLNKI